MVGAFVGPVRLLGELGERSNSGLGSCGDGRALVGVFTLCSVAGIAGGLVTGIVSDIRWLTGRSRRPTHNWAEPFRIND